MDATAGPVAGAGTVRGARDELQALADVGTATADPPAHGATRR
jgi:hypothetical protein